VRRRERTARGPPRIAPGRLRSGERVRRGNGTGLRSAPVRDRRGRHRRDRGQRTIAGAVRRPPRADSRLRRRDRRHAAVRPRHGQLRDRRRDAGATAGDSAFVILALAPKPHSTPTPSPSRPPSRPATSSTKLDWASRGSTLPSRNSRQRWPTAAPWSTAASGRIRPTITAARPPPTPTSRDRIDTLECSPRSHTSRTSYGGEPPSRGSSLEASTCSAAVPRSRCRSASASTDCSPSPASSARSCRCTSTPSAATTSERGNRPGSRLLRLRLRHAHARGDGDQFRHRLGARGLSSTSTSSSSAGRTSRLSPRRRACWHRSAARLSG